jgi:hypothetical protein
MWVPAHPTRPGSGAPPNAPSDRADTPSSPTVRVPRSAWDAAEVPPPPLGGPTSTAAPDVLVGGGDPVLTTMGLTPILAGRIDELAVIVTPDEDGSAPTPVAVGPPTLTPDSVPTPAPTPPHAPSIVTRLVGLGLVAVSALVLVSAMHHGHTTTPPTGQPRAQVSSSAPPATVRVVGGSYSGDSVLLVVDPVGAPGRTTLVVGPDAAVTVTTTIGDLAPSTQVPLSRLFAVAASEQSALAQVRFRLGYAKSGEVSSIREIAAG